MIFIYTTQTVIKTIKNNQSMKNLFLAFGLAVVLTSCGSGSEAEAPKVDSTAVAVDTTAVVACDSAATSTVAADTTK